MSPIDSTNPANPARATRPAPAPAVDRTAAVAYDTLGTTMAGPPPALTSSPSFGALLTAMKRRWALALSVALLGAGATFALLVFLFPPRYVCETRVQISRPPDYMAGGADGSTADDYVRTIAQKFRSGRVLNTLRNRPDVQGLAMMTQHGDDMTFLAKDLVLKPVPGENVVPLKLWADDANEGAVFLNALIEALREEFRRERNAQLNRLKAIVEEDDKEWTRLINQLPSGEIRERELLEALKLKLETSQRDLQNANSRLAVERTKKPTVDQRELDLARDEAMATDPDIKAILYRMKLQNDAIDEFASKSTLKREDPRLKGDLEKYESMKKELEFQKKMISDLAQKRLEVRTILTHENKVKELDALVEQLKLDEKELRERVGFRKFGQNPQLKALEDRLDAVAENRKKTLGIITRIQRDQSLRPEGSTDRDGKDIPWVQQLGQATVPQSKDYTTTAKVAGAASIGMFALLLFGVALSEHRSRRANSADEVAVGLGIPTVGAVPLMSAAARQAALTATTPRDVQAEGQLTESVDALRTLLLRSLGDGPQVVLITSAVQGEGKTSLASQLATSLARSWRKTLLIDGDLRKPAEHQVFNLPLEPGFSEVLRGEVEPGDAIKPTSLSRLWVMPAGQWDPHAQQALAQESLGHFFDQLKEEYEIILVDSCPVLPVADTLQLGQHVDAVLLSVFKGVSRLPAVYAARQRLAALDIPVLGAVFVGGNSALGALDIQYPRPATA